MPRKTCADDLTTSAHPTVGRAYVELVVVGMQLRAGVSMRGVASLLQHA